MPSKRVKETRRRGLGSRQPHSRDKVNTIGKSAAFLLMGGAVAAASIGTAAGFGAGAFVSTLALGFGVGFATFATTAAMLGREQAASLIGSFASCAILMHPWYAALPGAVMGHFAGVYLVYKLDVFDRSEGGKRLKHQMHEESGKVKVDLMPPKLRWRLAVHGVRMWFEDRIDAVRKGMKEIRAKFAGKPAPRRVPVETARQFDPAADKVASPWPATPPSDKPAEWRRIQR